MSTKILNNSVIENSLKEAEVWLDKSLDALSTATDNKTKAHLDLLVSQSLRDLGFINIFSHDFDGARENFRKACDYQKSRIEIQGLNADYWFGITKYIETAILSFDLQLIKRAAILPDWSLPLAAYSKPSLIRYPLVYEEARLILPENSWLSKGIDMNKISRSKRFFMATYLIIQAIRNKNPKVLKENIMHLVNTHKGEYRGAGDMPRALIAPNITALLILAIHYGIDLGDFDPSYTPMEYIRSSHLA